MENHFPQHATLTHLFCPQEGNGQEVFRPVCQLYYKIARKFMRKRLEAH